MTSEIQIKIKCFVINAFHPTITLISLTTNANSTCVKNKTVAILHESVKDGSDPTLKCEINDGSDPALKCERR